MTRGPARRRRVHLLELVAAGGAGGRGRDLAGQRRRRPGQRPGGAAAPEVQGRRRSCTAAACAVGNFVHIFEVGKQGLLCGKKIRFRIFFAI
jgi:hypothetical protein